MEQNIHKKAIERYLNGEAPISGTFTSDRYGEKSIDLSVIFRSIVCHIPSSGPVPVSSVVNAAMGIISIMPHDGCVFSEPLRPCQSNVQGVTLFRPYFDF